MVTPKINAPQQASGTDWQELLVGQDDLWAGLRDAAAAGTLPHLILLAGLPGNVQLPMAVALAQVLLCSGGHKPCGGCNHCRLVQKLVHPDLHFSFPLAKSKELCVNHYAKWRSVLQKTPFMDLPDWFAGLGEEGTQANIAVAEVQSILERLLLRPFNAACKVMLIWLPEYLGKESNRLLKIFEEAPQHTFILLVTSNPDALLSTVRSRAQLFRVKAVSPETIATYLQTHAGAEQDAAWQAALLADGKLQNALNLLGTRSTDMMDRLRQLFIAAYQYNPLEISEWVEWFSKLHREDQKQFIQWMLGLLSFVLRRKYAPVLAGDDGGNALHQYIGKLAVSLNTRQAEVISDAANDCLDGIQQNANVRLLMTDFSIALSHTLKRKHEQLTNIN
ncbi:MAG: hypothetical protein JPMHGGIA_02340 [Saprospiraceae bacterium]|jgi:DNA polymerase-3 subunit delta'|nr:hypothetical protein [Saprospiraceae bacterium]